MADRDLRRCPTCGRFFIENATYADPERCPQCGNMASDVDRELPGEAEVAVFEAFGLEEWQ